MRVETVGSGDTMTIYYNDDDQVYMISWSSPPPSLKDKYRIWRAKLDRILEVVRS